MLLIIIIVSAAYFSQWVELKDMKSQLQCSPNINQTYFKLLLFIENIMKTKHDYDVNVV